MLDCLAELHSLQPIGAAERFSLGIHFVRKIIKMDSQRCFAQQS